MPVRKNLFFHNKGFYTSTRTVEKLSFQLTDHSNIPMKGDDAKP